MTHIASFFISTVMPSLDVESYNELKMINQKSKLIHHFAAKIL